VHEDKAVRHDDEAASPVPAVNALLGGHVTSAFGNYSLFAEHAKSGKLRLLASASRALVAKI
jgi:tripartite-type tricarboxylate transporter receptor subunit TctC